MLLPLPLAILLDIEGTVCSIDFVQNALFPYSLAVLPKFLDKNWSEDSFQPYRDAFPENVRTSPQCLEAHVRELSAKDLKAPCLKQLQGLLWQEGYETGALIAPIYPDVPPAVRRWVANHRRVYIYSSGSVAAQKLLFSHTTADPPDMTPLFSGYYDTVNAGPKQDPTSYTTIATAEGIDPAQWLFLSDNVKEAAAAKAAGMHAVILVRPGNPTLTEEDTAAHKFVESFSSLEGI